MSYMLVLMEYVFGCLASLILGLVAGNGLLYGCLLYTSLLCIRRKLGKEDGGGAMYLETYSMEELMELMAEKGNCSVEAVEVLKEMEQAKKEYAIYSGIVRKKRGKQTRW